MVGGLIWGGGGGGYNISHKKGPEPPQNIFEIGHVSFTIQVYMIFETVHGRFAIL